MTEASIAENRPATRKAPARPRTKQIAAAGGASSGTLCLSLAQQIGPHTPWGYILTYSAPTIAVVSGSLMLMLKHQAFVWSDSFKVWSCVRALKKMLKDEDVSDAEKADLRKLLEEVRRDHALNRVSRVKKSLF